MTAPAFPTIPGFVFDAELGRGGMAAVYAATQQALGRQVAIKVVTPPADGDDAQLQRLENEARALAGLHHPNIVAVYQFGRTDDGALYYVMPLLRGGDLAAWTLPVDEARVIELLDALLSALAEAHAAGIIHRDIKPENILFDQAQRPRLADFGAALRGTRSRLTGEGLVLGSSGYMSPEQARGADVDARSDLYSLAVVAFQLLTGAPPFDGPDDLAIALAQCEQPLPALPPLLAHWQGFFERALHPTPSARFADAESMRRALHAIERRAAPRRPVPPGARAIGVVALVAGVLLVIVAALFGTSAIEPAEIDALIAQDALTPPQDPNALDLLLQARTDGDPAAFDPQRGVLLERLAEAMRPALLLGDAAALEPLWRRWHAALNALDAHDAPSMRPHHAEVERVLQQTLNHAARDFDRRRAEPALAIIDSGAPVSSELKSLAARIRVLPSPDATFGDPDGPPLWLVRSPAADTPGFAVTATAVTPAFYARFATDTGRTVPTCADAPPAVQACLDLDDANAFADWLSQRTGARYRVPDQTQLEAARARIQPAPAVAWTRTCNSVTTVKQPNIAQRAWGGVRSVFGGERAKPRAERRCDGYVALPLGGVTDSPRVVRRGDAGTAVVLVREVGSVDIGAD